MPTAESPPVNVWPEPANCSHVPGVVALNPPAPEIVPERLSTRPGPEAVTRVAPSTSIGPPRFVFASTLPGSVFGVLFIERIASAFSTTRRRWTLPSILKRKTVPGLTVNVCSADPSSVPPSRPNSPCTTSTSPPSRIVSATRRKYLPVSIATVILRPFIRTVP